MEAAATAATAAGETVTAATVAMAIVSTAAVWPLLLQKYGATAAMKATAAVAAATAPSCI